MIGSGFSRHGLKMRQDVQDPPLWHDVVEGMYDKLYPHKAGEAPATDGHLRIAQEYETAFGRSDLHRFVQQTVRDDDFKPGGAHARLLRLPWRDVFTTNWDTLLERVRNSVPDQGYSVVTNMDEIPLASRPRIVKLHGSLPAQFPLICTEEDYRKYPGEFAPFVNTVQQAMMETVFCLIGFSGDDPNFLQWSGWVRDNLGDAAPKIYLAGWLNLSPHRRRMLEDRNVVPVDLVHHPNAGAWPEHMRHYYATDWLLCTLEEGKPYDVTSWPQLDTRDATAVPVHLEPVERVTSDAARDEFLGGSTSCVPETDMDAARALCEAWTHNRKIYPGWLVAPSNIQIELSRTIQKFEPRVLRAVVNLAPVQRIHAIYELVWRRELLLEPIPSTLESSAEEALGLIDCQTRRIDGVAGLSIEWSAVREAWRNVALALVTTARHRFDWGAFNQRIESLSPFLQDDRDVDHRIRHERCLWAMYGMDFGTIDGLLKDWQTDDCDPAWMMRKAALLFESGQYDGGAALVKDALSAIRAMPANDHSLAGSSREGWALWLVLGLENYENYQMIFKRWRELASLECNAQTEMRHITDAVRSKGETKDAPSFDLGTRRNVRRFSSNEDPQTSPYRAIRLSEVVGLPPSIEFMSVAKGFLALAAEELRASAPEMAARLVLRTCSYDEEEVLRSVLSRTRVAAIPAEKARTLAEICKSVMEHALPRMGRPGPGVFWIERMRVAVEVLSRLVLRLESDKAESVLDEALNLYRNREVAEEPWMAGPVYSLMKRSFEALPEERRNARFPDVLRAPIVGLDGFKARFDHYPDPGNLWLREFAEFTGAGVDEGSWGEMVKLLVRGLEAGGQARKRAALRVSSVPIDRWAAVDAAQIAQALWYEPHLGSDGLPGGTLFYDWAFLVYPEPKPGTAERRFREKWLVRRDNLQEAAPNPHDILWQVGMAVAGLKVRKERLVLSENEQSYLVEVVEQWLDIPVPGHIGPYNDDRLWESTFHAIDGLRSLLSEVKIPGSVSEKLFDKVRALNESRIPGYVLIAGLLKALPNSLDEFVVMLKTGLASDDEDIARGAVEGLHHWARTSVRDDSQVQLPPIELIREVGVIIATRRKTTLGPSLRLAKWVFDEGSPAQMEAIRELTLQGLDYLAEELRYDRSDHDPDDDVPLLRWRVAQLAVSMAVHALQDATAVRRWLDIAENDPLPELRYVERATVTREFN